MKQYPFYFLDADETLFDFQKAERTAFAAAFQKMTGEASGEEEFLCYHNVNDGLWKALERGEITKPQLQKERFSVFLKKIGRKGNGLVWNETYLSNLSCGTFLLNGALELCQQLSRRSVLYLTTNGITRVQKNRLRCSELAPFIRQIFVSEEAGAQKPDPAYFDYVLRKTGITDRKKVLVVGDSLTSDMAGGIRAGLDTCWFNPSRNPLPDGYDITWEIHSLSQLISDI